MKPRTTSSRDERNRTHYSAAQNAWFCIKNTAAFYPSLLLWCIIAVLINTALPVLTTYLPKIVIEKITMKIGVTELAVIILCFMSCIALLEGAKKFFQKYLFHEKFSMPAHYIKKFAIKSLTTDYSSQENAVFRKLQAESYNCASGNSNIFVQIYDMLIELFTGILGLSIFWAILSQLNFMVIAFLAATTAAAFFLHQKPYDGRMNTIRRELDTSSALATSTGHPQTSAPPKISAFTIWQSGFQTFTMRI